MKSLVFFLEELSARRMLEGVLPRLIPSDINVQYVVFQGKVIWKSNLRENFAFGCSPIQSLLSCVIRMPLIAMLLKGDLRSCASKQGKAKPWFASLATNWKVFISAIWLRLNVGWVSGDWLQNRDRVGIELRINLALPLRN